LKTEHRHILKVVLHKNALFAIEYALRLRLNKQNGSLRMQAPVRFSFNIGDQ